VEQPLWDGGKTIFGRKIEKARLAYRHSAINEMETDVSDGVLALYRGILTSRDAIAIKKASAEALKAQRDLLQHEVRLGLSLPSQLAEAEITVSESEIEIAALEMELTDAELNFQLAIGVQEMPELFEKIDVERGALFPSLKTVTQSAIGRNLELKQAALAVNEKHEEYRAAALSWLPKVKLTGSFGVTGSRFPLSNYNWSAGVAIDFNLPWISGNTSVNAGKQGPHETTFRSNGSTSPLPNPGAHLNRRSAGIALSVEEQNYKLLVERLPRLCEAALQKCESTEKRRILAVESAKLAKKKYDLDVLRAKLGQATRIDVMESQVALAKKQIECVQAAAAVIAAERELNKLMGGR
jgi:outer membrane protein TolC